MLKITKIFLLTCSFTVFYTPLKADDSSFQQELTEKALQAGIKENTINNFFKNVVYIPKIAELDLKQPENRLNFKDYLEIILPKSRIKEGRNKFFLNLPLLEEINEKYGVPPHYLVAFWGLETNFGKNQGVFPLASALYTLAVNPRRRDFFTGEIISMLKIYERDNLDVYSVKSSWAGAFGHFQFMPSTYLKYAVDYDKDGKIDVVNNLSDALASASNYLKSIGWNADEKWGRPVLLPKSFNWQKADILTPKPISEWKKLGVKNQYGKELPNSNVMASLVLPMGHKGKAFLLYNNFKMIADWNNSLFYALAVGHFADRLLGKAPLQIKSDKNYISSLSMAKKLQKELCLAGFYDGKIDGILGGKTRSAIRNFQLANKNIPDGYPDNDLLDKLLKKNKTKNKKAESFACDY